MDAVTLRGVRPGSSVSGVARIAGLREEVTDGQTMCVLELRNGTGSTQAMVPEHLLSCTEPLEEGRLVHVQAVAEAMWEAGPVALRIHTIRQVNPIEVLASAERSAGLVSGYPDEILGFEPGFAAYLLWLMCADLERWGSTRRTRLAREEVVALALFLHDALPPALRTRVPVEPKKPTRKQPRQSQAA